MRTAAKRDKNEPEIIAFLRMSGCTVQPLSASNVPDLLVGKHGKNYLMEVKMPKGKLKDGQIEWHHEWGGQVCVVRNVEDAQRIIEQDNVQKTHTAKHSLPVRGLRLELARQHSMIRVRDTK